LHEPQHRPTSPVANPPLSRRTDLLRFLEALAIGVAGGVTFAWLGVPAGYLSGAMLAVAAASLWGRPLHLPTPFMHLTSATIGMTLGSVASPAMMHSLGAYPASLAIVGVGTAAVIVASTFYLRFVHGWDTLSAILAATPGALSQMIALSVETKSDTVGVSIAQTLRVVLLIALLPLALAVAGYSIESSGLPRGPVASLASLPILILGSLATGYLFFRLHFPGGWLFGAMFGSGLLHGFDLVDGGLPLWLVAAATISIGTMSGTRFAGIGIATLIRYVGAGAGSLVVALIVMTVFFLVDVWLVKVQVQDTAMAFAPGAMDVMMAIALTMHLDPVFVGAHHLFRFLGVSVTMPFVIRAVAPKASELPESEI
jgi:membrane AbrB-like protein